MTSPTQETYTIEFDGGSRGNPGPAGAGIVVRAADGTTIAAFGIFIGRATNNVAEYRGLIGGLEKALQLNIQNVVVRGDSQLIIKQMRGEYRVKHPDMQPLHRQASALAERFASIRFEHNLRHKNQLADKLANQAMDRKANVEGDDLAETSTAPPTPSGPQTGDKVSCSQCGCRILIVASSKAPAQQLKSFTCCCGNAME